MIEYDRIQSLLRQKADIQSLINLIPYKGNIEIKTVNDEKYIYVRSREGGRYTSTYVDRYSDELYSLLLRQSQELRELKKSLRKIEKELAQAGYEENALSPRVILNIDFGRANVKTLIYDQAVLEGISTTFPQTETIIENGIVNGVKASDVQKILNLKHAWEFILDKDVVASPSNYYLLSYIAKLVNEGFYSDGGRIRGVPVSIGGSSYKPPMPIELDVREAINSIIESDKSAIDKAVELCLYAMKTQIYIDGNKRSAIIFANHFLISNGEGLLVVPEANVNEFKKLLISYYEGTNTETIKVFLKEKCWRKF